MNQSLRGSVPRQPGARLGGAPLLARAALALALLLLAGHRPALAQPVSETTVVQAQLGFLASDALHGRGSGTRDEWIAATYVASVLREDGIQPGLPGGLMVQQGDIRMEHQRHPAGFEDVVRQHTWNVVGILPGSDPALRSQYIMLSAHLDHLGVGPAVNGDTIYNGADDDGSGTVAVMQMAHFFGAMKRPPRRSLLFVLFGSEELGGDGNLWFLDHAPIDLHHIVANIEFEMIGRRDPRLAPNQVWLSGSERSTLSAALVRRGAPLAPDPRPEQHFFERSDNFDLAQRGIVAHTASSFGLHPDYHHPSDEVSRIDFPHMVAVIDSMKKPLRWLANTTWTPTWLPGKSPQPAGTAGD